MIIKLDWSLCASPGDVDPAAFRDSLRVDPEFASTDVIGVTASADRPAGEEIEVELAQAPTAGQVAALDGVLLAHNAPANLPVGTGPVLIDPTPSSNSWTDVPGGLISVGEDETISGDCDLRLWAGADRSPAGVRLSFSASRVAGGSVDVASWGVPGGRVSGFKVRIEPVDNSTLQVQFQRRGNSECRVYIDLHTAPRAFV